MRIYDQKQVEQLRKRYPKGTRLCLDFMDEPGMPPGLQGTVEHILMMPDRFTCIGRMGEALP